MYGPYYQGDINLLESVQCRATKLVCNCHSLPYVERMCYLELPTLAYRRYRGDNYDNYISNFTWTH